jgi:hypothetical protein
MICPNLAVDNDKFVDIADLNPDGSINVEYNWWSKMQGVPSADSGNGQVLGLHVILWRKASVCCSDGDLAFSDILDIDDDNDGILDMRIAKSSPRAYGRCRW